MLNRKEIEYNVMSLVSTWLFDAKDVSHLTLILTNDNTETTIDCNNSEEVASQLSSVLINNSEKYTDFAIFIDDYKNLERRVKEFCKEM